MKDDISFKSWVFNQPDIDFSRGNHTVRLKNELRGKGWNGIPQT